MVAEPIIRAPDEKIEKEYSGRREAKPADSRTAVNTK
jgi:hypothetical protein